MNLEPGIYKIRKKSSGFRFIPDYHYLIVFVKNRVKYFKVDHGLPQDIKVDDEIWFLEGYEIVKKLSRNQKVAYNNVRIEFQWNDEENHPFKLQVRSWGALQNIFKSFPGILKALGKPVDSDYNK